MANTFDLVTKIPRAVRALIIQNGVGTASNTYAGESTDVARVFPNQTILCEDDGTEIDYLPGIYQFSNCKVVFRDAAITQPNDAVSSFVTANQRVSPIIQLLALSDDQHTVEYTRAAINAAAQAYASANPTTDADLADFGLRYYHITSYGRPQKVSGEGGGVYYERVLTFDCWAANSALAD